MKRVEQGPELRAADVLPATRLFRTRNCALEKSLEGTSNEQLEELIDRMKKSTVGVWGKKGGGSGVIISANEHEVVVLTNRHVVEDNSDLKIHNEGKIVDVDRKPLVAPNGIDLAIIILKGNTGIGIAATLASSIPKAGSRVLVMGSPLRLNEEGDIATLGIVSFVHEIKTDDGSAEHKIIQTDAAINPGNSGGPLIEVKTQSVVGINTSKIAMTKDGRPVEGIGFAISVSVLENFPLETWRELPSK